MLKLHQLSVGYHQNGLFPPIDAAANKGCLIGLLGVNGIGKSTLLKTVAGLQRPVTGTVEVNGENLHLFSPHKKATLITIAGTEREYIPFMSVKEFIQLGRYRFEKHNALLSEISVEVQQIVQQLALQHIAGKQLLEISDGERQKATVARALAQETPILLLDEPTAFLDYKNKSFILSTLRSIAELQQKIIIVSTHDLEASFTYCHHWWILNEQGVFKSTSDALAAKQLLTEHQ